VLSLPEQEIFERYKRPHFAGVVASPDFDAYGENASCGDEVRLTGKPGEIRHEIRGCAICTASADLLCEYAATHDIAELTGETLVASLGIPLSPVRLKCALLPLEILKTGLNLAPHLDEVAHS
jgi:nitrogen fixation NifU-like protein